MNNIVVILGSAFIIESLFLIVSLFLYINEKEKVQIERIKREEEKVCINIFIEFLEKRVETYELLFEFKHILNETLKENQNSNGKPVNADAVYQE